MLLSGLPQELRDEEALADHIDTYMYPESLVEPGGALLIYHKPRWRKLHEEQKVGHPTHFQFIPSIMICNNTTVLGPIDSGERTDSSPKCASKTRN